MTSTSFNGFNSLRTRILLNFLLMLTLVVLVTLYTVQSATYKHSTGQLMSYAQTSASVVQDKIENRSISLRDALNTLSKDFSFKQLIATSEDDTASLLSALENFQARAGADIAWVQDKDGRNIVSSPVLPSQDLNIDAANFLPDGIHWHSVEGTVYLVRSMPVKFVESSRNINAWVFMGIKAENLFNERLISLTEMNMSLIFIGAENRLVATTHAAEEAEFLVQQTILVNGELNQFSDELSQWIYIASELGRWRDMPMELVLSTVEDKAYLSYNSLLGQLIFILVIAAVMALVAAALLSNGITRPVTRLVDVANKIRQGKYVEEFPKASTNEVESLSGAIHSMQEGIKKREEEIQYLAYYDSLTHLPNRNQFKNHLAENIAAHPDRQLAVLMMDLDRFKEINDTIGHEAGDQLLKEIANRLKAFAYDGVFIAHIGGDEFAIVVEDITGRDPKAVAENFSGLFDRPFVIEQLSLDVDISMGIATYPQDAQSSEGLLQCADIALYSCKGKHFPYAIYQDSLNKYSVQRLSLMSELRGALAEGQLQLFYQPKLAISERKITTVECLIRWIHPVHGFIPPDEFIPLAEQTGAIRDVTHWGLRVAFKQYKQWQELGYDIGMAVNISAIDLVDMQLPTYVAELMSEFDVDNTMLTLEVTESAVMSDPESALKALNTLRRMGITLSIDDFGTGYSSMAQLKKMPVDELKIDKAFVLDLAKSEDDKIMVRTLMSLAQNLGLKTVAEGVEDGETLKFLQEVGCTKAQGFYMSRPLPADKFNDWLKDFNADDFYLDSSK
ncbi:putative bifunctional diguanylate cyclase/phosphodiesterase [Planctobacterium marinum]